jgi:hypothetical protein
MNASAVIIKTKAMLNRMKHLLEMIFEKNRDKRVPVVARLSGNPRNGINLNVNRINDRGTVYGIGFKRNHY